MREAPAHGAFQKVVAILLLTKSLSFEHYSLLCGHLCERQMYDSLTQEFHWPHMVSDFYILVNNCTDYPSIVLNFIHQRELELFPAAGSLEFVVVDIFGSLPKTKAGDQFIVIVTDSYAKLRRAISTKRKTSTPVANILFNDWIKSYRISEKVGPDNKRQVVSKLFTPLCSYLAATKVMNQLFMRRKTAGCKDTKTVYHH